MHNKKSVYLLQPNYHLYYENKLNYWLPYSVGIIWSYVTQFPLITDNFYLEKIIYKRENIEKLAQSIKPNSIVVLSTYIWNFEYNKLLAKSIKELQPDVKIIFGGPQVTNRPMENNFFKKHPFIDTIILNEGEQAFLEYLQDYLENNTKKIYTGSRLNDLDIPSPYLTGLFDKIMEEESDATWNAVIETNRGCPFACTFCDWGSLTMSKIKQFPEQRVFDELDWMGKNKIDYLIFADANFGIFNDRDYRISEKLCQIKNLYGYPNNLNISYAKNSNKRVVDIIKLLSQSSLSRGMTLSFQSLDDTVLENIKRKNMEFNKAEELLSLLEEQNLNYYTELILGLPGETLESWTNGIFQLLEMGQHQCIDVFFTQLLENSELNTPEQRQKYNIKHTIANNIHYSDFDLPPYEKQILVRSTNTLSDLEFIDAVMLSWLIINFHCHGWTQIYARFLHTMGVSYYEFYTKLHDYIKSYNIGLINDIYHQSLDDAKVYFDDNSTFIKEKRDPNLMRNRQYLFYQNKDDIHTILESFIVKNFTIDSETLKNLLKYQRLYITNYNLSYPYTSLIDYGIKQTIITNEKYKPDISLCNVTINDNFYDKKDFIKKITMLRRNGFGRSTINKI